MSQARDIAKALQLVNTDTNTIITSAYDSDSLKSSVTLGVNNPTGTINPVQKFGSDSDSRPCQER